MQECLINVEMQKCSSEFSRLTTTEQANFLLSTMVW